MNSIKLEVGKMYITRGGDIVEIIESCKNIIYPFKSAHGLSYSKNGAFLINSIDRRDIISEHKEELGTKPQFQPTSKARHKHADMIIAWANGAEIEVNDAGDDWYTARYPTWVNHLNYRIKPEPVKNTRYLEVTDSYAYSGAIKLSNSNVKAEFIDGKLVSIELIKD